MSGQEPGALKFAAELGDIAAVKRLVEEGVSVDQPDQFGDTALHAACAQARDDVVRFLLDKGADPNVRNKSGSTPLHKAVTNNEPVAVQIIRMLMKNKADPTICNAAGKLAEQLTTRKVALGEIYGDNAVNDGVDIPKQMHGRVIGKGGAKLREIQEASCTVVTVPKQNEPANTKIAVFGRPENVEKAKKLINEAVYQQQKTGGGPAALEEDDASVTRFPVPKHLHSRVIGKQGKTINDIRDETGVQIFVPRFDDPDSNLILKGESDDIDAAIKMILQITNPRPSATDVPKVTGTGEGRKERERKKREDRGENAGNSNNNEPRRGSQDRNRRNSQDRRGSQDNNGSPSINTNTTSWPELGAPAVKGGRGDAAPSRAPGGRAGRVQRLELGHVPTEREKAKVEQRKAWGNSAAPAENKEATAEATQETTEATKE